ncbi:TPA: hypothetical protein DEP58_01685 [Patescibacteria group bacterium]|nr:hypothetical protein [Patescibacteria group bacterium]
MDTKKITITTALLIATSIIGYGIWIGSIQAQISSTETLALESKDNIRQLDAQNQEVKLQLMKLETQLVGIQVTLQEIKSSINK